MTNGGHRPAESAREAAVRRSLTAGAANWKTTTTGIVTGLIVILTAVRAWLDGDPATVPDANAALQAAAGIALMVMGFFSRDADKSSQDSGIRPDVGED